MRAHFPLKQVLCRSILDWGRKEALNKPHDRGLKQGDWKALQDMTDYQLGQSNPASLKLIKGALQSIQACKPMSSRTVRSYWCVLETRGALRFICPARLTIGKGLLSESHPHCFKSSSAVPPLQSGISQAEKVIFLRLHCCQLECTTLTK